VIDRVEADLSQLRDQQIGGDDQGRGQQEVPGANTTERGDFGRLLTGGSGRVSTKLLQSYLVRARQVT
jgi:hypothetical protein